MDINRRNFLTAVLGVGVAIPGGISFAAGVAPDPNDPNDPNKVTDVDGEIGKPYRGWKEGEYDIHFIHTGVTENTFHIFPDGTTAVVDCGDQDMKNFGKVSWNYTKSDAGACAPMPNDSRLPSEWCARYIARLLPELNTIDYVVASHFHTDHIGSPDYGAGMTQDRTPNYQLSGIANLGEYYRFGTAFDRGYPDYSRPTPWASSERENLLRFFEYKEKNEGLKREKFEIGALDQIKPLKKPGKYDFHVRNVAGNGVLWDGADGSKNLDFFERYPKNKETNLNENTRSLATATQFGAFRYYSGGDISGVIKDENGKDVDYEGAVGRVVGKVDVCKTNHHASGGAMGAAFVNAVQARVYVTCCWWAGHLNMGTSKTMSDDSASGYPGPRLLCPTDPHPMNAEKLEGQPWRKNLVEIGGHVVVKAYDGGDKYKIYYLTAKDETMNVQLVFGPFDSKGTEKT